MASRTESALHSLSQPRGEFEAILEGVATCSPYRKIPKGYCEHSCLRTEGASFSQVIGQTL
jgi:hypothetical protein